MFVASAAAATVCIVAWRYLCCHAAGISHSVTICYNCRHDSTVRGDSTRPPPTNAHAHTHKKWCVLFTDECQTWERHIHTSAKAVCMHRTDRTSSAAGQIELCPTDQQTVGVGVYLCMFTCKRGITHTLELYARGVFSRTYNGYISLYAYCYAYLMWSALRLTCASTQQLAKKHEHKVNSPSTKDTLIRSNLKKFSAIEFA